MATFYIIFVTVLVNGGTTGLLLERLNLITPRLPHAHTRELPPDPSDLPAEEDAADGKGTGSEGQRNGGGEGHEEVIQMRIDSAAAGVAAVPGGAKMARASRALAAPSVPVTAARGGPSVLSFKSRVGLARRSVASVEGLAPQATGARRSVASMPAIQPQPQVVTVELSTVSIGERPHGGGWRGRLGVRAG